MRLSTRLGVSVVCVALLTGSATLAASSAVADGPQASAAKSSKKKAKRKAKRFLDGALWTNITSATFGPITTYIALCTDGTYYYRKDNSSSVAASQTTFNGVWKVKTANTKKSTATLESTVENFRSVYFDGSPGPDSPPASPATTGVFASSENQVFFDGVEYTRTALTC